MNATNATNATEKLCNIANYLVHDTQLTIMLSIRVAAALVALLFFAILFKTRGTYLTLHSNARVLLITYYMWVVLQAVTNLITHSFNLLRFAQNYVDPCEYLVSTIIIVFTKGPTLFTLYGQVWAIVALTIERCVATYRLSDYEAATSMIGKILGAAQWLLTMLWICIALSTLNMGDLQAYTSIVTSKNGETTSNLLFILAVIEILSISIVLFLLAYNRRKSKQSNYSSLSEKYQIEENIRATQLMLPMYFTHFCCFMPSLIGLPIYLKFIDPTLDPRYYIVFLETTNTSPFNCIFLPIVLFWLHKVLRQNLRTVLRRNEVSPDAPPDHQHQRHFELLKDMWRGPRDS